MTAAAIAPPVGVILAGGGGRRLGGVIKADLSIGGVRLIDRVRTAISGHCDTLILSVREAQTWAKETGLPLVTDGPRAGLGPLAGLAAALAWTAAHRPGVTFVLSVTADCPFLPDDLVSCLTAAIEGGAPAAIAASAARRHPLIGLWPVAAATDLMTVLDDGPVSGHRWAEIAGAAAVSWPTGDRDPFFNVNTPEDLALAEVASGL